MFRPTIKCRNMSQFQCHNCKNFISNVLHLLVYSLILLGVTSCRPVMWVVASVSKYGSASNLQVEDWPWRWRHANTRELTNYFCLHSLTLGSTQPLTKMSTKGFPWGQSAAGAWSWELCRPICAHWQSKIRNPTFYPSPESSWLLWNTFFLRDTSKHQ